MAVPQCDVQNAPLSCSLGFTFLPRHSCSAPVMCLGSCGLTTSGWVLDQKGCATPTMGNHAEVQPPYHLTHYLTHTTRPLLGNPATRLPLQASIQQLHPRFAVPFKTHAEQGCCT